MVLLLYSVREFWKRCQTSLRGMLCLLKITKTFQAFLTVLCNKANLLAVHYSWDGKNLLIVSCWLSNRQQAVPVPQWAQPSPMLLNYNSMLSTQRISWSHQPLENILIETTSIIKYGSTICQAVGGKKCFKGPVCMLEYTAMHMKLLLQDDRKLLFICRKHRWNGRTTSWESPKEQLINN